MYKAKSFNLVHQDQVLTFNVSMTLHKDKRLKIKIGKFTCQAVAINIDKFTCKAVVNYNDDLSGYTDGFWEVIYPQKDKDLFGILCKFFTDDCIFNHEYDTLTAFGLDLQFLSQDIDDFVWRTVNDVLSNPHSTNK